MIRVILLTVFFTINLSYADVQHPKKCLIDKKQLSSFLFDMMEYSLDKTTKSFKDKLTGDALKYYGKGKGISFKNNLYEIFTKISYANKYNISLQTFPDTCTASLGFSVSTKQKKEDMATEFLIRFRLMLIEDKLRIFRIDYIE